MNDTYKLRVYWFQHPLVHIKHTRYNDFRYHIFGLQLQSVDCTLIHFNHIHSICDLIIHAHNLSFSILINFLGDELQYVL